MSWHAWMLCWAARCERRWNASTLARWARCRSTPSACLPQRKTRPFCCTPGPAFFVGFLFPFLDELPPYQFFDTAIPKAERQRIMGFCRACLQRHLYTTGGGRHFVAKNPAFSAKIETLLEFFPDARILYLVRNPLDVLPSTISWLRYAWYVFSDPQDKYPYRDEILALAKYWYEHPLRVLDNNPSSLHVILNFEELIRCPGTIIRDLYNRLGYPQSFGLEQIIRDAVAETRPHHSAHVYNYEEMGFSREEIVGEFAGIFERFGFDRRETPSGQDLRGAAGRPGRHFPVVSPKRNDCSDSSATF